MQESFFERRARSFAVALVLVSALASCTAGKVAYTDRVKALGESAMSPQLTELASLLAKSTPEKADTLVKTWHEWLADRTVPLVNSDVVTFVYYDFDHAFKEVALVANFASDTPEALERVVGTHLFFRSYSVPRREKVQYHYRATFADGTISDVGDPFNRLAFSGTPNRYFLPDLTASSGLRNVIDARVEPQLKGQNLVLYIPPYYLRNLARSYPVVYLVGTPEGAWDVALEQTIQKKDTSPVLVVSIEPASIGVDSKSLESLILNSVKPWIDLHYRTLSDKDNTVIVGWGRWSQSSHELANARPDLFGKRWIPVESTLDAWNRQLPEILHQFFPTEVP